MKNDERRLRYQRRIYSAQDYICRHIAEELNLEKIASISAFSPFHFHRIFKEVAGETPYDFIQRVRLERACSMLCMNNDLKIINIALSSGFSGPSSFSKAFRKHYGISPSEYRKSKNGTQAGKRSKESCSPLEYLSDKELEKILKRRKRMNVRLEELPKYRTAYMRQIGPYGDGNFQLMQRLKKWAITRDLFGEATVILGIAHDDPKLTPPEKCRYDCGVVIPDDYELEKEINEMIMPGGRYVVFGVEHTSEAIAKAWDEIFSLWLPESGYQIDGRPIFERYSGGVKESLLEPGLCEICLPVRPL